MRRAIVLFTLVFGIAASAGASEDHAVQPGETLSHVAARYGVELRALAEENNISDVDWVVAGTVLSIPGRSGVHVAEDGEYVVSNGDTLSAVAQRFGTDVADLARRNGIPDPNVIVVGQRLTVPASSGPDASGAEASGGGDGGAYVDPYYATARRPDVPVPDPASWDEVEEALDRWSARNGLDPRLAKAVAWHESGWRQDVVSYTGAIGVMQLMPSASEHVSRNLIGRPDLDPYSVEDNVRMGVRYLSQLMASFGGDERLAVASYYQGERAVREVGLYPESERYVSAILTHREDFRG